jgi:hypothetical protein
MQKLFALFLAIALLCPCPVWAKREAQMTQLQLRDMQTRIFDTPDTKTVFKAAIHTLQDNGFIVQNVEDEMGFIRARKEFKGKHTCKKRMTGYSALLLLYSANAVLTYGATAYQITDPLMRMQNELAQKTMVIDTNVNIEPYGKSTKVRFTLVQKILENADGYSYVKSSPRRVIRIREPILYAEFFSQMGKNIFYEQI